MNKKSQAIISGVSFPVHMVCIVDWFNRWCGLSWAVVTFYKKRKEKKRGLCLFRSLIFFLLHLPRTWKVMNCSAEMICKNIKHLNRTWWQVMSVYSMCVCVCVVTFIIYSFTVLTNTVLDWNIFLHFCQCLKASFSSTCSWRKISHIYSAFSTPKGTIPEICIKHTLHIMTQNSIKAIREMKSSSKE